MADPSLYLESDDEEEVEQEGFLEWISNKVQNSGVTKNAVKLLGGAKWCSLMGLKVSWVVVSTAIIFGLPYALAVEGERNVIEMQKQMSAQSGAPAGAVGPGGLPAPPAGAAEGPMVPAM